MAVNYRDMGIRIRKKREESGLSQAELAERAQLSTQHISNVENARSKIGLEKLVTIANVLDSSVDELVCGSIKRGRTVYNSEIAELLEDFSDTELRMLPDVMKYMKYFYQSVKSDLEQEKGPDR